MPSRRERREGCSDSTPTADKTLLAERGGSVATRCRPADLSFVLPREVRRTQRYNSTDEQYLYYLGTTRRKAGGCRVTATRGDGTLAVEQFSVK